MKEEISVVIVDDHPVMAEATKQIVEQIEGLKVIGFATNGHQGMDMVDLYQPNLVLLDYQLPDHSGISVAKWIKDTFPSMKIVMLTGLDVIDLVAPLTDIGVHGIISKEKEAPVIKRLIECILDNQLVLPHETLTRLIADPEIDPNQLTQDETKIMELASAGDTSSQIADKLFVSKRSIDNYMSAIYRKLAVRSKAEAIAVFQNKRKK
ncbi:DNA-binding response regulator [Paenibacillus chitinolyticus]|uniref:response regulator transcription factor n=1 Tax=Paenibacillus chitinolyticus TaxID=79263 RepID=UPI0026E5039A|nr:response regulator transcription factor [Paenibacillus chitinolyticus]GKS12815.1 DNA-binding response regulator [Paenibacillus chitinolyticus]